jgi:cytosine/adenosine deaminase-related metal-dependent hydrolase
VGAPADLVGLDAASPHLAARRGDFLLDAYVFGGARNLVRDVWRGGRHVVAEGRHHARDRIVARYRSTLAALLEEAR